MRRGAYDFLTKLADLEATICKGVPERHGDKNGAHLDLDVADLDAAVGRVLALGGHRFRAVKEDGIEWVAMADPDGNAFGYLFKAGHFGVGQVL